jgi:phosphoglucomutase
MMQNYRSNPPKELNGSPVICIKDYKQQLEINCVANSQKPIALPQSNVLQFFAEDGFKSNGTSFWNRTAH